MAIDTLAAGHVPFMDFDVSTNMRAYSKVLEQLLAYDSRVAQHRVRALRGHGGRSEPPQP